MSFIVTPRGHIGCQIKALPSSRSCYSTPRSTSPADKFDIPALKLLAAEKFTAGVGEKWSWNTAEFAEAADLLWENTIDSDKTLRDAVVSIAIKHMASRLAREDFLSVMKKHFSFACIWCKLWRKFRRFVAMKILSGSPTNDQLTPGTKYRFP
jgi:hypothetical protein